MIDYMSDFYYEVEVRHWNGGDYTWKEYLIFKNQKKALEFAKAHKDQLATEGWETTGKVETKKFADARTE